MSARVEQASAWIYRGVWRVLVDLFRVPEQPPTLPSEPGETLQVFRPGLGFLRYLKFQFWIWLTLFDGGVLIGWIAVTLAIPWLGALLALPALAVAVLPDVIAYIAIHLRYDTTWYVLSKRSLRIRRGLWIIHETTITYENVQNLHLRQGPLQQLFGITDLLVETAGGGGGGGASQGHKGHQAALGGHRGLIEGVANAQEIRDLIVSRQRRTKTAGLGDEDPADHGQHAPRGFAPAHLAMLREIRDAARRLSESASTSAG